jgi:prepilin-type N-terminal cleavage/methylation domain-containing protein/prepilin-type processing-associated H-X9-DG protein
LTRVSEEGMLERAGRWAIRSEEDAMPRKAGFTLIELLVVIAIIGVLVGILVPVLARARRSAVTVQCASNLRQVATAFTNYLNDTRGMIFWRAPDPSIDGMDWYVYGGNEQGNLNTGQSGLFNRIVPRPLNTFVSNKLDTFRCPADEEHTSPWAGGSSHFAWVGNSYNFNALGAPGNPITAPNGLAGKRIARVRDSARTILFLDASLVYPGDWHGQQKGNICLADGHVVLAPRQPAAGGEYSWF